jgi:hypothetical protein
VRRQMFAGFKRLITMKDNEEEIFGRFAECHDVLKCVSQQEHDNKPTSERVLLFAGEEVAYYHMKCPTLVCQQNVGMV